MRTSLDCIPCLVRQALEAARALSTDPAIHEQILREVLAWTAEMDLAQSTPFMAQRIHRRLREVTGMADPYREAKERFNAMAMRMVPRLRAEVESSANPLQTAIRLAIAGNVIDMAKNSSLTEESIHQAMDQASTAPFFGEVDAFAGVLAKARHILYLADNAGEIAFDRLLIEQIDPRRVTLAVRGAPVINDATRCDARAVGLEEIVRIIDNGSDAPGTILADCSQAFRSHFARADLIIAKGQGNFESLSHEAGNLFFLFKVKCPLVASHVRQPEGTHILTQAGFDK